MNTFNVNAVIENVNFFLADLEASDVNAIASEVTEYVAAHSDNVLLVTPAVDFAVDNLEDCREIDAYIVNLDDDTEIAHALNEEYSEVVKGMLIHWAMTYIVESETAKEDFINENY